MIILIFNLIQIWPRDWNNQLERMNMKVDEDNGKSVGMVNGRYQKFRNFQAMDFGRTLAVLFNILPLVLGSQYCGISKSRKR